MKPIEPRIENRGEERSIELATSGDGTEWGARLETYLTDPAAQPDPSDWVTELAILINE